MPDSPEQVVDLNSVDAKLDLVLTGLTIVRDQGVSNDARIARLEEGQTRLAAQVDLLTLPPMRLPLPSLTGEERKAQTESIRVAAAAITTNTAVTTAATEVLASHSTAIVTQLKSSKWWPVIVVVGVVVQIVMQALK